MRRECVFAGELALASQKAETFCATVRCGISPVLLKIET